MKCANCKKDMKANKTIITGRIKNTCSCGKVIIIDGGNKGNDVGGTQR